MPEGVQAPITETDFSFSRWKSFGKRRKYATNQQAANPVGLDPPSPAPMKDISIGVAADRPQHDKQISVDWK